MTILPILLVLSSGLVHAVWNLFTKKSINKTVFLWFTQLVAILAYFTVVIQFPLSASLGERACLLIAGAVLAHAMYVVLLAAAYTVGDLSQVYPIMRGTSPLLVPLAGVLLLGERLPLFGWIGTACIVVGILLIQKRGTSSKRVPQKATVLALGVGLLISTYTVLDKQALQHMSAVTLNYLSNIGNFLALSLFALRSKAIQSEWRANRKTILLGGILAPGGYLLFLAALRLGPVAMLAPMREIGTVFGTVFGVLLLQERQAKQRIGASIIISIGVICLGFLAAH